MAVETNPCEAQIFKSSKHILFISEWGSGKITLANSHMFGLLVDLSEKFILDFFGMEGFICAFNVVGEDIIELYIEIHFREELFKLLFTYSIVFQNCSRIKIVDFDGVTCLSNY